MGKELRHVFNKKTIHLFALLVFTLLCSNKFPNIQCGSHSLNNLIFIVSIILYIAMEIYLQKEYYNIQNYKTQIANDKKTIESLYLKIFKYKAQSYKESFKNSQIDSNEFWCKMLARISKDHNFSPNERISIYRVYRSVNRTGISDDVFNIKGRYSKNSDFNDSSRKVYPANVGVIGEAYKNESHYVNNLPEYKKNPMKYKRTIKDKYKMDFELVDNLNMKSRSYGAFVLKDEDDTTNDIIIVFESILPNSAVMKKENLERIIDLYKKEILNLMKEIDVEKPALDYAEERGY